MQPRKCKSSAPVLSPLLSVLLVFQTCFAQTGQQAAPKLTITIVEGEGAINNVRQRVSREPIVQVEDENHKPIAGAAVVFTLPSQGASGVFPNGSRILTVLTDNQGRAAARGLKPNNVAGRMEIRVNASYQGQTASASITQVNSAALAAAGGLSATAKILIVLGVVGGAAAGAAVALTRGGGSSTPAAPATTLTPGAPTVGGPR